MNDLQFDVDNVRSYESFKQKGLNTNLLTWTALRSSIINMKSKSSCSIPRAGNLDPMNFDYKSKSFNAYTAKCKQFYSTMISSKARIPNGFKKLTADFGLSNAQEVFSIPYLVAKGKQLVNLSKCELCLLAPSLRQQLVIVLCFYRVLV